MSTTQRIIKELHIMGAISEQTALNAKEVAELADTKQAHARLCELRDQGLVIASSRTGRNNYWLTLAGVQYAEKMEEQKQDQPTDANLNQANNDSENSEVTDAIVIDEATNQANSDDDCLNCTQDSCGSCDEAKPIPLPHYNPDDVAFKKSNTVFWYTVDGIKEVFETSSDAIYAAQELVKNRKIFATVHAVASKPHAIIKPVVTTELEYL